MRSARHSITTNSQWGLMRLITIILGALFCTGTALAQSGAAFENEEKKTGYAVGMSVAENLSRQGIEVDIDSFIEGIRDVLTGKKPRLSQVEFQQTMRAFGSKIQARRQKMQSEAGAKNLKEGKSFLAKNKKKKGVVTLPSGLQYQVLRAGKGTKPTAFSTVVTHYRGTLLDGSEFDSSYGRGKPASFRVNGVIAGWTEALQLMPEGSKWRLFIPSGLAYGPRGTGRKIGPHATLIFEIELIEVK